MEALRKTPLVKNILQWRDFAYDSITSCSQLVDVTYLIT